MRSYPCYKGVQQATSLLKIPYYKGVQQATSLLKISYYKGPACSLIFCKQDACSTVIVHE